MMQLGLPLLIAALASLPSLGCRDSARAAPDTTPPPCTPSLHDSSTVADELGGTRHRVVGASGDGKALLVLARYIGPGSAAPHVVLTRYQAGAASSEQPFHLAPMIEPSEEAFADLERQANAAAGEILASMSATASPDVKPLAWCATAGGEIYAPGMTPSRWKFSHEMVACPEEPAHQMGRWKLCPAAGGACIEGPREPRGCSGQAQSLANLVLVNGQPWAEIADDTKVFDATFRFPSFGAR